MRYSICLAFAMRSLTSSFLLAFFFFPKTKLVRKGGGGKEYNEVMSYPRIRLGGRLCPGCAAW